MAFYKSWLRKVIVRRELARIVEWIRDYGSTSSPSLAKSKERLVSAAYRPEISNLDANGLSNCLKLSDNPRIKTVEYNIS